MERSLALLLVVMNQAPPTNPHSEAPAGGPQPSAGQPAFGQSSANAMSIRWSALHDAGAVVASLAGVTLAPMAGEMRAFPAIIRDTGGWRCNLADQGIADLAAVMEPGLAALLSIHARGADTAPAALALWQEYQTAQAALLALAPPVT